VSAPNAVTARLGTAAGSAEEWLFGAEEGRRFRAVQIGLAALLGLRVALGPYRDLAGQPAALFDPPAVLRWLPGMPPLAVLVALQAVGALAALLVLARVRPHAAFVVAWVALVVLAGLRASRGKILHNDVLLLLAAVPFLAATAGSSLRDRRRAVRFGWPVRTAMVVVCGAYFWCGLAKLVSAGPLWAWSDNLRYVLYAGGHGTRTHAPDLALFVADHGLAARLLATGVLTLELVFPLALVRVGLRPWFALGAAAMHASIWLLLGLDYWAWAGTAIVVLVDPAHLLNLRRLHRPQPRR